MSIENRVPSLPPPPKKYRSIQKYNSKMRRYSSAYDNLGSKKKKGEKGKKGKRYNI